MNINVAFFHKNDWFVILSLCIGAVIVYFLPKRFPKKTTNVFLLCGVFFGFFFDHTLSVLPVNFYDLNDSPRFELIDFLSQCMYAPFSYLFFYLYDRLNVRLSFSPVYTLVWVLISVGVEKVASILGVFHYNHGYNLYYSFCIYLVVLSFWVAFYYIMKVFGDRQF